MEDIPQVEIETSRTTPTESEHRVDQSFPMLVDEGEIDQQTSLENKTQDYPHSTMEKKATPAPQVPPVEEQEIEKEPHIPAEEMQETVESTPVGNLQQEGESVEIALVESRNDHQSSKGAEEEE